MRSEINLPSTHIEKGDRWGLDWDHGIGKREACFSDINKIFPRLLFLRHGFRYFQ